MACVTLNVVNDIETARLRLICTTKEILEALFMDDKALSALLNVSIPDKWTEFGEPAFRWTYDKINSGSTELQWWTYLPVLRAENILVGSCGYKGRPQNGMVEIGYEVAEQYRGKGLATELSSALIKEAMKYQEVQYVQAHTLAANNESVSVLKKCGMKKMEEIDDPEDGMLWRWELRK